MLITKEEINVILQQNGILVHGALHIGAHECEEQGVYRFFGIADKRVIWIDALQDKVDQATRNGIPNVYQAVVSDKDGEVVSFYRTNNDQSSSILELGTHAHHHPWCVVTGVTQHTTTTIDTFMADKGLDPSNYNFWNFDIQGAELKALMGGENCLKHARALYLEVNSEQVYKGCPTIPELDAYLALRGFRRVLTKMTEYGWGDALYIRS
jgi:FkbM family methyltransferase